MKITPFPRGSFFRDPERDAGVFGWKIREDYMLPSFMLNIQPRPVGLLNMFRE